MVLYTEIESLMRFDFFSDKTLIYITAIYFLTQPVAIILAQLLKKWSSEIPDQTDGSLVNAGKYIGMLERLYVFGFVLSGNIQAIGFLIAAKSVFRFGDLKESKSRKLTEYILIGTLLSFGIAVVSGLLLLKIMESYKGI